jgi:hypothetical protein
MLINDVRTVDKAYTMNRIYCISFSLLVSSFTHTPSKIVMALETTLLLICERIRQLALQWRAKSSK